MDPVQITMLGVGVALAALIVTMIGSLRRDMEKRFDDRIDGVEKRFEERFDGMEKRIDNRFAGMEKRIDNRFDGMEKRIDGIDARLHSVEQALSEMKGRFAFVESYILRRTETVAEEAPAE
ncbi:MAG: hypothetical protein OXI22_04725 [Defluviicoccus sp.]|nr:hypothetical protein [Defluviicoccus sp.]MDE0383167.1 hypothetical protein [Defluviicoccus sp.]